MAPKKQPPKSPGSATKVVTGFTDEERAAAKERVEEKRKKAEAASEAA